MRKSTCFALLAFLLTGHASHAVLHRYAVRTTGLQQFDSSSPQIQVTTGQITNPSGTAVIDDDGGSGSPVLLKWVDGAGSSTLTVDLPALSGFLWISTGQQERMTQAHTGTGVVETSIEWGLVDGWTVVGGEWCHSVPASICNVNAMRADQETVPPPVVSSAFDMGSWLFHGTGFRGDPRIIFTQTTKSGGGAGNAMEIPRGFRTANGAVPGLPLIGLAAVMVSIVGMGVSALRRR